MIKVIFLGIGLGYELLVEPDTLLRVIDNVRWWIWYSGPLFLSGHTALLLEHRHEIELRN